MLSIVLAVLIVYGMSLIIVQGSIFSGIRNRLNNKVESLNLALNPTDESVGLLLSENKFCDKSKQQFYDKLINLLKTASTSDPNFEQLTLIYEEHLDQCIEFLKYKNNKSFYKKMIFKILSKIKTLTSCMMCTGFWIGGLLILLSTFGHIGLFGVSIVGIIPLVSDLWLTINVFLGCCLFSGTTWILNTIVDLLYELKEHIVNNKG